MEIALSIIALNVMILQLVLLFVIAPTLKDIAHSLREKNKS